MNLNEPLIPGVSLAGFKINENIKEAVGRIPSRHRVERLDRWVIIDDGFLTITFDKNACIYCITCDSGYGVKYKNKLWAGDVSSRCFNNSTKQAVYIDFGLLWMIFKAWDCLCFPKPTILNVLRIFFLWITSLRNYRVS